MSGSMEPAARQAERAIAPRIRMVWAYLLAVIVAVIYIALGMAITLPLIRVFSKRLVTAPTAQQPYSLALLFFLLLGGVSLAYYASKIFLRILVMPGEATNPRLSVQVSIIIPAYNAENTINRVLRALIEQDYPRDLVEVIVVDDGSSDATYSIARFYADKYPFIRVVRHRVNLGKARAITNGVLRARGDVIVLLDADTVPEKRAVRRLVSRLVLDDALGAVSGNIAPAGFRGILYWLQRIEYLLGFSIGRFFADKFLGANPVLSGAFSAFRAPILKTIAGSLRGVPEDNLAEDFDLTLAVWKKGYRTGYEENAVAYTIVPRSLRDLYRQRIRWYSGGLQVIIKHLRSLGVRRHVSSRIRRLVLFDTLLTEYFLPLLHVSGYLLIAAILLAYLFGLNLLAIPLPLFLAAFISALVAVDVLGALNVVAAFALVCGARTAIKSVPYALVYVVFYIPFLAVAKVDSIIRILKGVVPSWY